MPSRLLVVLASISVVGASHAARAQSLVGALVPETGSSGTDLIVIDPATGAHDVYMRVPHDTTGTRVLYHLTSLPDCKLAASMIRDIASATVSSQYVRIDLNGDGVVDDSDFTLFVQAYNRLLCGA
ncbi:MAG: hypothetical protein KF805_00770 [Phycisphaeraceae bacterium]|nr:hypothetical protein [Phycisphaeraceae bacterium]